MPAFLLAEYVGAAFTESMVGSFVVPTLFTGVFGDMMPMLFSDVKLSIACRAERSLYDFLESCLRHKNEVGWHCFDQFCFMEHYNFVG